MADPKEPVLVARDLVKEFGSGPTQVTAVDHVSIDLHRGRVLLLEGPSGSGKTTLVTLLGLLLRPDHGTVRLAGFDPYTLPPKWATVMRLRHIGFVFQDFRLLSSLSALDNVMLPARIAGRSRGEADQAARALLDRLGVLRRADALPRTLSGGEKQRVALARALVNRPDVIFADEPTGNLDSKAGRAVAQLLKETAHAHDCAVLVVSHDTRIAPYVDEVRRMEDGRLLDRT